MTMKFKPGLSAIQQTGCPLLQGHLLLVMIRQIKRSTSDTRALILQANHAQDDMKDGGIWKLGFLNSHLLSDHPAPSQFLKGTSSICVNSWAVGHTVGNKYYYYQKRLDIDTTRPTPTKPANADWQRKGGGRDMRWYEWQFEIGENEEKCSCKALWRNQLRAVKEEKHDGVMVWLWNWRGGGHRKRILACRGNSMVGGASWSQCGVETYHSVTFLTHNVSVQPLEKNNILQEAQIWHYGFCVTQSDGFLLLLSSILI